EQVVLGRRYDEPATVRVTRLVGEGLQHQMAGMHRRDTSITAEAACQKLRVESFEIKDEEWVFRAVGGDTSYHDRTVRGGSWRSPTQTDSHFVHIEIASRSRTALYGLPTPGQPSPPVGERRCPP